MEKQYFQSFNITKTQTMTTVIYGRLIVPHLEDSNTLGGHCTMNMDLLCNANETVTVYFRGSANQI